MNHFFVTSSCDKLLELTLLFFVGISAETNNGIKKEVLGKDAARIWINDNTKVQNFPHFLVSIVTLIQEVNS